MDILACAHLCKWQCATHNPVHHIHGRYEAALTRECYGIMQGGVTATLGLIFMRETYGPVLLARKAKALRRSTGDDMYRSQHEIDLGSMSKVNRILHDLVRPVRMLFTEPILFVISVDVSIIYGYLYLVFTTLTYVYMSIYGFSSSASGLAFLGIGIGMLIGKKTPSMWRL